MMYDLNIMINISSLFFFFWRKLLKEITYRCNVLKIKLWGNIGFVLRDAGAFSADQTCHI